MRSRLQRAALAATAGFLAGCSSLSPVPSPTLHSPLLTSGDGAFQYRLPDGWFDATADTQAAGHVVWLLRNDYEATIAVSELHLDARARDAIRSAGVMGLAQLSMAFAAGQASYTVTQQPGELRVNGRPSCVYALVTAPAHDTVRVVLVDTGIHVYMVTALVVGATKGDDPQRIFGDQDAFVASLRW